MKGSGWRRLQPPSARWVRRRRPGLSGPWPRAAARSRASLPAPANRRCSPVLIQAGKGLASRAARAPGRRAPPPLTRPLRPVRPSPGVPEVPVPSVDLAAGAPAGGATGAELVSQPWSGSAPLTKTGSEERRGGDYKHGSPRVPTGRLRIQACPHADPVFPHWSAPREVRGEAPSVGACPFPGAHSRRACHADC